MRMSCLISSFSAIQRWFRCFVNFSIYFFFILFSFASNSKGVLFRFICFSLRSFVDFIVNEKKKNPEKIIKILFKTFFLFEIKICDCLNFLLFRENSFKRDYVVIISPILSVTIETIKNFQNSLNEQIVLGRYYILLFFSLWRVNGWANNF